MKKLIVMVLVLVMLASMMALPAMAAEIQPRTPYVTCVCGASVPGTPKNGGYVFFCPNCHKYI